jgi:hypothetical protein
MHRGLNDSLDGTRFSSEGGPGGELWQRNGRQNGLQLDQTLSIEWPWCHQHERLSSRVCGHLDEWDHALAGQDRGSQGEIEIFPPFSRPSLLGCRHEC